MSPEQVRAETVDQRSDIFSLGCVLYEMVSGQRAFTGDSAVETMNAILKEEPTDVSASGAELPPELAGTIRRCLEKRPRARFQSASDLAYNLRTISSASLPSGAREATRVRDRTRSAVWFALAAAAVVAVVAGVAVWAPWRKAPEPTTEVSSNKIAIVPLENRTGDPSLDTLGVMAADLIEQRFVETGAVEVAPMADVLDELPLGGLEAERRRGWTQVLRLASERGAGLVLSGAYYLDGEPLRLQARLVDVATGDLIYTFEPVVVAREAAAEGIETLRERVLAAVAAHVNLPGIIDIAVLKPPARYEAFQSFQQGEVLFTSNPSGAIAHFRSALQVDPEFHLARFTLIWVFFNTGDRESAEQEISAADGYLHRMTLYDQASLRYVSAHSNRDRAGSADALRYMLELWPDSWEARNDLGWMAISLNRPGEAVEVIEPIAFSLPPSRTSVAWWSLDAMTKALHMLGDYERELEYADLGLERHPDVGSLHLAKARALSAMGLAEEVKEVIDACLPVRLREGGYNLGRLMTETASELRAHGHRRASDDMAALAAAWWETRVSESGTEGLDREDLFWQSAALFIAGRVDDANQTVYEIRDPGLDPFVAGVLGVHAARLGNHEEARQFFDELPDPGGGWAASDRSYWRAAIAATLGEKDRAVALLAKAFSQGMSYNVFLHSNLAFETLWDYPPFQKLIEPKG
jgi:TolB-like protein